MSISKNSSTGTVTFKVVRLGRELSVRLVRPGVSSVNVVSLARPGTESAVILLLISCNSVSCGAFAPFTVTVKKGLSILLIDSFDSAENTLLK